MTDSTDSTPAPWLRSLTELVTSAKRDDPMAPVTVLVPTNIAGIIARRHLAHGPSNGAHGIAAIWFTTPSRLAEQLAAPALHAAGRLPATPPVLAALTGSVLAADPGQFGAVASHHATIQSVVRAHAELNDIDPQALDAVAAVSPLSADMVRVHRQLRDRLADGWYESSDILAAATDCIASGTVDTLPLGVLIDYLPGDRTRLEKSFVAALSASRPMQSVSPPTTLSAVDPPAYADRIVTASDSDDEVRAVVREVVAALPTTPAHRVAVLYTDRTPYVRLLHEQLTAAEITINGAGVRPVLERSVPRAILGVLDVARTGWARGDLFRALGEAPVVDRSGEPLPRVRWERTSREAGVIHGDDWSQRLANLRDTHLAIAENVDDDSSAHDRAQRIAAQAEALRLFVADLQARVDGIDAAVTWQQCATRLAELVESLLPLANRDRLPLAEQYAAGALDRAISSLAALDATDAVPSLAAAHDSLVLSLDAVLPRVGRFGEGVYVGPLHEAVGMDLDRVFVVGLSEDIYPGRLHEDSLLPERVRTQSCGQLRSLKDSVRRKERDLVYAFTSAGHVTASFARGDLRKQTARLPSRWLMPTLRSRTGDEQLAATDYQRVHGDWLVSVPSFAAGVTHADAPATEQEWRLRAIASGKAVDGAPLAAHRAMLEARSGDELSAYDGNLAGAQGLPLYADSEEVLSATSLEKYAVCPYAWFAERQLNVKPIEDPDQKLEVTPAVVGNIIHESFDRWVREYEAKDQLPGYGVPWSDTQRDRLLEIAGDVVAAYEAAGQTGHARFWATKRRQILDELAAMVDRDNEWRIARDARVIGSELAFGRDDLPPVMIDTTLGALRFRGAIDKVDETRDGTIHVTDIKTGSPERFRRISEANPVASGAKLQLPLYAHAARARLGRADAQVEAHYWFVLRENHRVRVPLTPDVEATYDHTLSTLVESIQHGLYPQRAPDKADYAFIACHYCNPDGLGHVEPRRRWEQVRDYPVLRTLMRVIEPDVAARLDQPSSEDCEDASDE
ncbi:PD-(D/E)XK nuclease family protein [Epidermidibacterium keratini]|uniref:PD-(D/E)XK nuclease family protein n=1 Tax=Epidermidibacterium keratini TaxID=1891644 RepID=A0A7L4YR84_9ACTN|nr:PD-(D/E)XK nuclease family protein [Epidermidibacterium keratini]QHC01630.1 PD-(D/E)XK nuclease family protein [Epidermidibacterium keratini]